MAELLSDELWGVIEPHLPKRKRRAKRKGGRPPIPDRQALTGILFVGRTSMNCCRPIHRHSLQLAAGQAAVYALPLGVVATLGTGEHDLPVTLQVDKPNGTGARLPGSRRHLYDLWTIHFAVSFTVDAALAEKPTPAGVTAGKGRCLSLASVGEPEPRLAVLHALVDGILDQTPTLS